MWGRRGAMPAGSGRISSCRSTCEPGDLLSADTYGMRGSHPGRSTWLIACGTARRGTTRRNREEYDLIVVGGGLSGLGAAYYFRKAMPEARVLVLDNHDDFGGHAKRNEARGRRAPGPRAREARSTSREPIRTKAWSCSDDVGLDAEEYKRANVGRKLSGARAGFGERGLLRRGDVRCRPAGGRKNPDRTSRKPGRSGFGTTPLSDQGAARISRGSTRRRRITSPNCRWRRRWPGSGR